MKFATKKALVLLVSASIALAGAGCATDSNNGENAANTNEKTVLKYWTHERGQSEFLSAVVEQYNATNKDNIFVEPTFYADNYMQSLDIAFASGQAPDVFNVNNSTDAVILAHKKGYLEPLDAYLTEEMKERFAGTFREGVNQIDGATYSLPNFGTNIRLIYNADLFAKAGIQSPPKSLAEMVDAAKKITEAGKSEGAYGFSLPFKNAESAFGRSAAAMANMSGFHQSGFDFRTAEYDFSGYKEIVNAFKQMWDDGSMLPGSESLDIDPLRAQFAEGKIGMYLSYSVEPGVYQKQFATNVKWAAALPPSIDGTPKGAVRLGGGAWYGISKDSSKKEAAWKFLSYMHSEQVLLDSQEKAGWISIVPDIAAKAKTPEIPGIEGFLLSKYDAMWPVPPSGVSPEGKKAFDEFFEYVLSGGDLDKVIADLNNRYNAALDKAKASGEVVVKPDPDFDAMSLQGSLIK